LGVVLEELDAIELGGVLLRTMGFGVLVLYQVSAVNGNDGLIVFFARVVTTEENRCAMDPYVVTICMVEMSFSLHGSNLKMVGIVAKESLEARHAAETYFARKTGVGVNTLRHTVDIQVRVSRCNGAAPGPPDVRACHLGSILKRFLDHFEIPPKKERLGRLGVDLGLDTGR